MTCEPNELAATLHNRMPVIIDATDYKIWLTGTPEQSVALLKPYPAETLRAYLCERAGQQR